MTSQDWQAGYISSRGLDAAQISPERLPAREAPLEQLSHSTHHVPGNGPARVGGWGWMDSWTLHLWQLYLEWSSEHKQGSGRRDPCVARI